MERGIDFSAPIGDEVRTTTCYMCACRCGIRVHLKDGTVRYIEGNPDHPVNRGVLCAKGSAGIMQHYSPARLSRPLLRTGERGQGEFREISWEEAIGLAVEWLRPLRETDPRRLAFFTGRDQSQALTGWWASRFGTPNHAAHGGFCSVNMAAAGLYSIGASFWEFGEPDWEHARWFMMLGVAEDHDSNPIKLGLARLKERGAKVISVNPVRTGYSAIADEWVGITPGTDGLLVLSLAHELLRAGRVDADYLASYTNAPWLVVEAPGDARDGLFARDAEGRPLVWDRIGNAPRPAPDPDVRPALRGRYELPDGTAARPAFELLARRCLDPAPRAGGGRRRHRGARRHHPAPCGGDCPRRLLRDGYPRRPVDGRPRPPPREDGGAPRRVPRDARDLRPLERVPDLPGAPRAADAPRDGGRPGRVPLQGAVPEVRSAAAAPGRPSGSDRGRAAHARPAPSAFRKGRRTCWSTATGGRTGSTRRSPGRPRSPPTG